MKVTSKILELDVGIPGPSVAIFAGIHGDERVGIKTILKILPRLKIQRGKLFMAFANPPAIEKNVRLLAKNLNRCFLPSNDGVTYEDVRARELMKVLDKCDALLDLHAFREETGEPFAICPDNALPVANKFDINIISTNWTKAEPGGTDSYMEIKGKIGVCLECGPISKTDKYMDFTEKSIYQFLKYFDLLKSDITFSESPKRIIKAEKAIKRYSEKFYLNPKLKNFQQLETGKIFGYQGSEKYIAEKGQCIIFPWAQAKMDTEAFVIGREIKPKV